MTKNKIGTPSEEKKKRGFALWPKDKLRRAASAGGFAAQSSGKAHKWTPEEAEKAGRKGGLAYHEVRGRQGGDKIG